MIPVSRKNYLTGQDDFSMRVGKYNSMQEVAFLLADVKVIKSTRHSDGFMQE